MYSIGDKVTHPMHGAGVISDIIEKTINGVTNKYYILKLPNNDMLVMIPVNTSDEIGVRPVMDVEHADAIIFAIKDMVIECDKNWSRRYRENMVKLKSGDLMQVAQVIKSLANREKERGLSTGERRMLNSAKQIFISEIVLAKSCDYEEAERLLNAAV